MTAENPSVAELERPFSYEAFLQFERRGLLINDSVILSTKLNRDKGNQQLMVTRRRGISVGDAVFFERPSRPDRDQDGFGTIIWRLGPNRQDETRNTVFVGKDGPKIICSGIMKGVGIKVRIESPFQLRCRPIEWSSDFAAVLEGLSSSKKSQ